MQHFIITHRDPLGADTREDLKRQFARDLRHQSILDGACARLIGNALAHDVYFDGGGNKAQAMRRVMWSKFALLVVALIAAYVAAQTPAGILYLVASSFSLAGAAFVPVMVMGIFWKGATHAGAVAGMLSGLGVTLYYMAVNVPWVRQVLDLTGSGLWWGIQPVSAGVFGVAAGIVATLVVSLLTTQGRRAHS